MPGGNKPRRKGFDAEREIVQILAFHGIPAKRSTCSFGADIQLENGTGLSIKRRRAGMGWAYDELKKPGINAVLFRSDREQWIEIRYWPYSQKEKPPEGG